MKVVLMCGPFNTRSGYGDHARSIFLVRFSFKPSSNVPPEGKTRESTIIADLNLSPCLRPFFLEICTLSKDTRMNFKFLLTWM